MYLITSGYPISLGCELDQWIKKTQSELLYLPFNTGDVAADT